MTIGCIIFISVIAIAILIGAIIVGCEEGFIPSIFVVLIGGVVGTIVFFIGMLCNIAYHRSDSPLWKNTIREDAYFMDDQGFNKMVHIRNTEGVIIATVYVKNNEQLKWFNNKTFIITQGWTKDMLGNHIPLKFEMEEKK